MRMVLGKMAPGQTGVLVRVGGANDGLARRLMEMGFLEGSRIEVVHQAPFGGDPMVIRVRGALVAIRRQEGNLIDVEIESETAAPVSA